ncbi:hypothetical protein ABT124_07775 [Streptomyces sp. NPDC001982]
MSEQVQELDDRCGQSATWDELAHAYHQMGRHTHAWVSAWRT